MSRVKDPNLLWSKSPPAARRQAPAGDDFNGTERAGTRSDGHKQGLNSADGCGEDRSSALPSPSLPSAHAQVVHPVEECAETLSFASEPVLACLANVLTPLPTDGEKTEAEKPGAGFARDYTFLDVELKYGILQVSSARVLIGDR